MSLSRYLHFSRKEWAQLRNDTPQPFAEDELARLRGLNEPISLDEVEAAYLPLARLLRLYEGGRGSLYETTRRFLGHGSQRVPWLVGLAGSVAVGKSTTARVLQHLLARGPDAPRVALVTTDGFLHANATLQQRGLMERKGFPESYNLRALVEFLFALKSGQSVVHAPVYSHLRYDIVPGATVEVRDADIVIVEGLNILQPSSGESTLFASDFFDFSLYVDAEESLVREWYIQRFLRLRETAFANPESYFHHYAALSHTAAIARAGQIWDTINGPNLRANIQPTRERADLILRKCVDHKVESVQLKRI
jgi:type I pantothenate kinase